MLLQSKKVHITAAMIIIVNIFCKVDHSGSWLSDTLVEIKKENDYQIPLLGMKEVPYAGKDHWMPLSEDEFGYLQFQKGLVNLTKEYMERIPQSLQRMN